MLAGDTRSTVSLRHPYRLDVACSSGIAEHRVAIDSGIHLGADASGERGARTEVTCMPWSTRERSPTSPVRARERSGTTTRSAFSTSPDETAAGFEQTRRTARGSSSRSLGEAMKDLYNPAQLDVVQRTEVLLRAATTSEDTAR